MMKRTSIAGLLVLMASGVWAHDMFLVLAEHSLDPNSPVSVSLYNGTFDKSENAIARDRMLDVSVVNGAARVSHPATDQWRDEGQVAILEFETGEPGTYVVGVSTAANMIELTAEEFDDYLKHDGVLDVLEARHHEGDLTEPVRERYSKHVKTILQVGDAVTDSQSFKLGQPSLARCGRYAGMPGARGWRSCGGSTGLCQPRGIPRARRRRSSSRGHRYPYRRERRGEARPFEGGPLVRSPHPNAAGG